MSQVILVTVSVWPCRSVVGPGVYGMLSVYEHNDNNNYIILLWSYNYKGLCKLHAQMVDYFSVFN